MTLPIHRYPALGSGLRLHLPHVNPHLQARRLSGPIRTTLVMGVVNASPDSFSDVHEGTSFEALCERAAALVESGADIIDVGGQSASTNRAEIDVDLEIERVIPLIEWLRRRFPALVISVDTYRPKVVQAVLEADVDIINDVSGLRYPEVAVLCADAGAGLVIMHTAAPPKTRLQRPDLYADITSEVRDFLTDRIDLAQAHGLARESVIVDPGPDFTKTPHQTVELLRELNALRDIGRPILLALSRKDFLGAITQRTPRGRDAATNAAIAHLAQVPGSIVRVHDVAATVDVIATIETLVGMRDIDADYVLPDELRYERPT